MPRPLNRRQARENARFLAALARTGNARLAAHVLGVHRSTYTKRRARHPAFAAAWDAALATAETNLATHDSRSSRAKSPVPSKVEGRSAPSESEPHQPLLVRRRDGRLQLRRALPHQVAAAEEAAFLAALAACNNVRAAAAAAGFAHSTFHRRAHRRPDFAAEMKLAQRIGADRLEHAAMESAMIALDASGEGAEPGWQSAADDLELPKMSIDQVLQFLGYRERARRNRPAGGRPLPPMPFEEAEAKLLRAIEALKRVKHFKETGEWRLPGEAGQD